MNGSITAARIYTDFGGLAELKAGAREQSPEARKEVARQFEAMFIQIMLKSMRQAGELAGGGESEQVKFYQEMFDQQVALDLASSRSMGLARVFEEQLEQQAGAAPAEEGGESLAMPGRREFTAVAARSRELLEQEVEAVGPAVEPPGPLQWPPESPEQFLRQLWPAAREAAGKLGVEPEVVLAQAALESGWGRHSVGRDSYNLFGIKADSRWQGEKVEVSTLEYRDGVPVREKAAFRRYDSPTQSLEDYVNFIRENPRYSQALEKAGDSSAYLRELQRAGYATDPRYAEKIEAVLASPAFSRALAGAKGG